MRIKPMIVAVFAVLLAAPASTAFGQVSYAARGANSMLSVGGGLSSWDPEFAFGKGRVLGFTGWMDLHPPMPWFLKGLGGEFELRDSGLSPQSSRPSYLTSQASYAGGPTYTYSRKGKSFKLYAKGMVGYGTEKFVISFDPSYTTDSRDFAALGGGFVTRVHGPLLVRADYEIQAWQKLFGMTEYPKPQGISIGVMYELQRFHLF